MAIESFSCAETQELFTTGKSARFANIKKITEQKLVPLDVAPFVLFMKGPPGNDLKKI